MSRGPTYTNFVASGSVTMLCIQATTGGSTKFQQLAMEAWRQLLSRPSLCQHAHPGPLECRHSTALAAAVVPPLAVGPAHICHQHQYVVYLQQKQMASDQHVSHQVTCKHCRSFHEMFSFFPQGTVRVLHRVGCMAHAEMS